MEKHMMSFRLVLSVVSGMHRISWNIFPADKAELQYWKSWQSKQRKIKILRD
jgi:hypothetical protein